MSGFEQIVAIAIKNLKIKLRNWHTYLYTLGFPIIFTILFFFMFGSQDIVGMPGWVVFDFAIAGMLVYAASFGTINAASAFSYEKHQGTLIRLDTTPVGRDNIFIGTLVSEAFLLIIQLIIMFILGYAVMGLKWHNNNMGLLLIGFLIMFIFGLSTLGLGIIISAYAKTEDAAVGIAMMYALPITFLSGAMVPFDSPIVYAFPPFYAFQIYKQVVLLGENFWTTNLMFNDPYNTGLGYTSIPLWGAFLIIIAFLAVTILIGILLFQRKTLK
ncbi:MAG: ABC transporter permease [Candidatus Helarchaeota archaeon]|nr:ABC transporter permease [Candidatus Helarchaeota archaeon]